MRVFQPFCVTAALTLWPVAHAQDRRVVHEPVVPPACVSLEAQIPVQHGRIADQDEQRLDTARIQKALDHCGKGKAVHLVSDGEKSAFLSGPLDIPGSVTLVVDAGATLFASRDPRQYDVTPGACGIISQEHNACKTFIVIENASHAGIMGEGTIDGRGGSNLLGKNGSWWDLAADARGGGRQQVPRLIDIEKSDDITLYKITLKNSPNFHVVYRGGKGFTVWGIRIDTPKTARNTDGIDPSGAEDVTITRSSIRTGDDNVAVKGSAGGVKHMSVTDNHFYWGHGMSIGSETYDGVSDLLVKGLTLDGTESGIRIKSNLARGGVVDRVMYEDVCIRDSKNPIFIDTGYGNEAPRDGRVPDYRRVELHNVQISGGGKIQVDGLDAGHRTGLVLNGVMVDSPSRYKIAGAHSRVAYGPGAVNFRIGGADVLEAKVPGEEKGPAVSCGAAFVPFPAE